TRSPAQVKNSLHCSVKVARRLIGSECFVLKLPQKLTPYLGLRAIGAHLGLHVTPPLAKSPQEPVFPLLARDDGFDCHDCISYAHSRLCKKIIDGKVRGLLVADGPNPL